MLDYEQSNFFKGGIIMGTESDSCSSSPCGCACPCHKSVGVLIILFGLTFLLGAFDIISARMVSLIWPTLIVLVGLKKTMTGMCKCCKKG